MTDHSPRDLVLCVRPDGWSLHAPGSSDEDIASGDAPYILVGFGKATSKDREKAFALWLDQKKLEGAMKSSWAHQFVIGPGT
jgi:hypothetical protein